MKTIITRIFVTLGIIFLVLIFIGAYFFIVDPYDLKPLLFGSDPVKTIPQDTTKTPTTTTTATGTSEDTSPTIQASGGFELSEAQKQALISFGIDPTTVPTSINTEQEACFTGALGVSRVAEIKAGAVPNALEFLKAKSCI